MEHIQGKATDMAVLDSAAVCEAKAVVCLSRQGQIKRAEFDPTVFDDQDVILTALALDSAFSIFDRDESVTPRSRIAFGSTPLREHEDIFALYEIQNQESISHLLQNYSKANWQHTDQHLTNDRSSYSSLFTWPVFAAGRVYAQSIIDALLVPLSTSSEAALWSALFDICSEGFANEAIAARFVGRPYEDLCCQFARSEAVVLGLFRPTGTHGGTMPYVHTNPHSGTVLVQGDRVLVIKACGKVAEVSLFISRYCTWF